MRLCVHVSARLWSTVRPTLRGPFGLSASFIQCLVLVQCWLDCQLKVPSLPTTDDSDQRQTRPCTTNRLFHLFSSFSLHWQAAVVKSPKDHSHSPIDISGDTTKYVLFCLPASCLCPLYVPFVANLSCSFLALHCRLAPFSLKPLLCRPPLHVSHLPRSILSVLTLISFTAILIITTSYCTLHIHVWQCDVYTSTSCVPQWQEFN